MKIIEVELKNHIVIGDIHIKTDNEINSFIGVNGSGKSILLSTLQPFGTSDRYSSAYPILPEKSGYKKIVYQINDIIYETIHEYTPNNKQKHSCKSYLNRIHNGIKEELNPNGHVNLYEELVEKYLHFTRDVLDICYITSKADGLTSATPKRRKEILEVTNASSILLRDYQKIISDLVKDNKAIQRVLGEKRVGLLNNKTESMLTDEISLMEMNLEKENITYKNSVDLKIQTLAKIESLNQLDLTKADMEFISKIIEILKEYNKESLIDIQSKYNQYKSDVEKSAIEIQFLEKEQTDLTLKEQKAKELEYLQNELNQKITNNKKSELILNGLFNVQDYNSIVETLNILKREYIPMINRLLNSDMEFQNMLNRYSPKELYNNKKLELEELKKFVTIYNSKLEESNNSINFNSNDIQIQENCNKCPLYNKMVLSVEFINKNKDKYDESVLIIPSIENELKILDTLINIENNNNEYIDLLIKSLTDIGLQKTGFSTSIIEMYKINKQYNEIINYILETINTYYSSQTEINNLNQQINLHEKISVSDIKNKINDIQSKITQIKTINQQKIIFINKYNADNISFLLTNENYSSKKISTLIDLQDKFQNKYQIITETENLLKTIEFKLSESQIIIDNLKNNIILAKNNLTELKQTLKTLVGIIEKGEYYKNIKLLLEKDIPILLLQSQLEYIQYQTNQILEDNDIDIQIEIKSTGSDIIIPAYINGRINPDIRNVSQGESCLISLLINACMCHILGYNIIYLDEIDANLDSINRDKFNNIIYSILSHLNINQIFCISHNIANSVESAQLYALGKNWRNLNFGRTSQVIELSK